MGQLDGRTVIVTGGARGIGRAIIQRFALEGAAVVIDDVDDASGAATASSLAAQGAKVCYVHADVSRPNEVLALVQAAEDTFGSVDILVNNAIPASRHIVQNEWDPIINVCLKGAWLCMRAVLPRMVERGTGSIINISSINALAGFGDEHVYIAAKAGLIGMSRSMAVRYGRHGVRINVICPGTIVTDVWAPMLERQPDLHERLVELYPLGRLGQPDEIAGAALYFAGTDSSFASGSVLVVDGGVTAGYTGFTIWDEGQTHGT
jgi:meso-butanediol dehydrogenase/(S,S)-butanediol dehydrogenase/diacetyl reductase